MIDEWVNWVDDLAFQEPRYYSGPQKIFQGKMWQVPGSMFFDNSINMQTFGYTENGNKMSFLKRHYYNREKIIEARKTVKKKWDQNSYGSASFELKNITKHRQDFCMQSCTVTHYPAGGLEVCIFYRVTEPIKKFGADLVFLKEVVLPRFNRIKSIETITFMFSNISWHPMFICTYLAHHHEPVEFMRSISNHDPKWHKGICKWAIKYLFEGETSWVQNFSIARQNLAAMKRLMDKETEQELKDYFEEFRT
jgi:hypothetical protein